VFAPKAKVGQWTALIETQADGNSDGHSQRSILNQSNISTADVEVMAATELHDSPHSSLNQSQLGSQIKKTTEVNVSYYRHYP
jgi:hypothetical protein